MLVPRYHLKNASITFLLGMQEQMVTKARQAAQVVRIGGYSWLDLSLATDSEFYL